MPAPREHAMTHERYCIIMRTCSVVCGRCPHTYIYRRTCRVGHVGYRSRSRRPHSAVCTPSDRLSPPLDTARAHRTRTPDRDSNPHSIFRSARSARERRRGARSRRNLGAISARSWRDLGAISARSRRYLGDISRLIVAQRDHRRTIRRVVSELGEIAAQRVEAEDLPTWT